MGRYASRARGLSLVVIVFFVFVFDDDVFYSIPSFFASRVSLELGASSSLSMLSKSGRKSLVSIRFLGCLPMSAWALLDESVEL